MVEKQNPVLRQMMILQTIAGLFLIYMVANGYIKNNELVWLVHEPEKYKKYQAENVKFVSQFQEEHDDPQGSSLPLCIDFSLYFLHPGV